ncbi:hypothetical protein Hanom_Chr09g00797421 [Helianthus anomalus]
MILSSEINLSSEIAFRPKSYHPKVIDFENSNFINRCRWKKSLTDRHKAYRSRIERFWTGAKYEEADKAIHSFARIKENDEDKDVEVIVTPAHSRRVLDLKDNDDDPVSLSEICE